MKFKDVLKKYMEQTKTSDYTKDILKKDIFMEPCIPLLKLMPLLGFLPMEFQSGITRKEDTMIRNRAFITGLMEESHAQSFLLHMSVYTDKTAVYVPIVDEIHNEDYTVPVSLETTSKKINIKQYYYMRATEDDYEAIFKSVDLAKKEKVVYLVCWDPVWNKDASAPEGLFSYMISVLKYIAKN